MRHVARKSLITVAAAGGVLAVTGGYAHADSGAQGSAAHSPGVLSGNTVQAPVHIPVNACGNTVTVIGALNPAAGNSCANGSDSDASASHGHNHHDQHDQHGATQNGGSGGASAEGGSSHSPGVGSGNTVQVPVDVPVNVCGNSVNVVGALNPAAGNDCANESGPRPEHPGHPGEPEHPGNPEHPDNPGEPEHPEHPEHPDNPGEPEHPEHPDNPGESEGKGKTPAGEETHLIAQPGGDEQLAMTGSDSLAVTLPISAGLLIGGALLYRRSRAKAAKA